MVVPATCIWKTKSAYISINLVTHVSDVLMVSCYLPTKLNALNKYLTVRSTMLPTHKFHANYVILNTPMEEKMVVNQSVIQIVGSMKMIN